MSVRNSSCVCCADRQSFRSKNPEMFKNVLIKVFVQNEAGSNQKNYHDEKTLEYKCSKRVSRVYPYPYGFIVGTTADDGLNLDCFIITQRPLKTGQTVECEPIGLMEQIEDGLEDHNVLAKLTGDPFRVTAETEAVLTDFVQNVFRHTKCKKIRVGRFLGAREAQAHINRHWDP